MFSTTSDLTAAAHSSIGAAGGVRRAAVTLRDLDGELTQLRMLTRAGELHPRDSARLIADVERRIARRDTLGLAAAGLASTLEIEVWHGDDRDQETLALRGDLHADGLL